MSERVRPIGTALACLALLSGSGCAPVVAGVAAPMLIRPQHVNVLNASYAAADTLIQQSQVQRYPIDAPVRIFALEEIPANPHRADQPSPMLGRVIATQIRARFQQLGYTLAGVNQVPEDAAVATVEGAYRVLGDHVNISLRFRDVRGGRVLGIYDYSLPTTSEVRKYLTTRSNAYPALDWSAYPDFNL